jgi:chemotaxis protein methyltransferase CheR
MTLAEHHPDIFNTWKLNFIATDLSQDVLEQAVAGRYTQLEVNRGLPAPMLIKYFKRNGDFWFVDEKLRSKVMFRELNLIADWPLASGLDVVFLRNVLIYFDIEVKKQILGKIRKLLRPGGVLFLGSAETTLGIDDSFERVVHDRATCYRNPG